MTADVRRRAVPHTLRVTEDGAAFGALFAAIAEAGDRVGWLELESATEAAPGAAEAADAASLTRTLDDGAWKAVAVEPRRTLVVKSRRGPPVLRDLLREHFRGCRLVLVRSVAPLPSLGGAPSATLRPRGSGWEIEGGEGEVRRLTTADLVRALRAPRLAG